MIPAGWRAPVELRPRSFFSVGIGNTPTYQPIQLAADLNLFPLWLLYSSSNLITYVSTTIVALMAFATAAYNQDTDRGSNEM